VAPELAWNTWDADHPACWTHLPTGVAVRVSAFSTRTGRATGFPFGPGTRLGPHLAGGQAYAEVELAHDGARLRVRFAGTRGGGVAGDVEVLETREWGLRFWFLVEVGFGADAPGTGRSRAPAGRVVRLREPEGAARYVDPPVAVAEWPGGALAFAPSTRPVAAHLYDDRREAAAELEAHGYYHRPPARPEGRWAVYRFNAVTPKVTFAVAPGPDAGTAAAELGARAEGAPGDLAERAAVAGERTRAAAIRDVVAWNTVWDPVNARPYTAATRAWVSGKFGGWVVWQLDAFFNVLLAARAGDRATAQANLDAALAMATGQGNLAALRSGRTDWVDRSHPPIGALAAWSLYQATGDRPVLERAYPVLARAHRWWFQARDGNRNGLLEYGSSPVGDGHFVHTKLAAMDESAMDNSPVHDEAGFDLGTHTLDTEDVGLNSLLVLDGELLARIAALLGRPGEAAALAAGASGLAARVRATLWDAGRGIYANRRWDGRFARSLAPTSFYPLLAGIATPEQAATMVREHLLDPGRFGGPWPVAGTPHDDPASLDNVYWRGRVWPCFNFLVYRGLRRYRFDEAAAGLAARSVAMFERGWAERRSFENFNQRTGEGGDSVDADPFYSWGALLPLLGELDLLDLDPWDGLVAGSAGTGPGRAELPAPAGTWRVELAEDATCLRLDGEVVLEAGFRGRLRDLRLGGDEAWLTVPPLPRPSVLRVRVRGELAEATLPSSPAGRRLRLRGADAGSTRLEVVDEARLEVVEEAR